MKSKRPEWRSNRHPDLDSSRLEEAAVHTSIPQLALVPETRTCPQWCVDHDYDIGLCVGASTDLNYPDARAFGDALTSASVRLLQDKDEPEPIVSLVLNAIGFDVKPGQVEDLAWALLATIGKAGLR